MKKTFLKASALILSVMCVLSFTGCNKSPVEAGGDTQTPTETGDNKSTQTIDLNGETIKISMWWDGTPADEEGKAAVLALEEKYNCKIEYINIPFDSYVSKFNASVLAGEPIADISYMEVARAIPALAKVGTIIPVDEYFDLSDPKWPANIMQMGRYAGKQYGFSNYSWESGGIYYNKELIEKAGVPDPLDLQEKGEWTWDAFLETAKAVTKDTDGDGTIDQWGLVSQSYSLHNPMVLSNNGEFIKMKDDGTAQFVADAPNTVEALQFLSDLHNKYKVIMPPRDEADWYDAPKAFSQGIVGMFFGQQWDGVDLKKSMTKEYGFVAFPKGPKSTGYIAPVQAEAKLYVMPKGAKHPKEAAIIFQELVSFDQAADLTAYKEWIKLGLYSDKYLLTADKLYANGKSTLYAGYQTFDDTFRNTLVEKVIKGSMPVADFIKENKEEFQKALDNEF